MNIFRHHKIELVIFSVFLIAYTFCASDSVVQGDTGEFLASAAVHGVPHDPGYPLYSILTQLIFSLTHSVWALHALSGLFAAVTLVITYRLIYLLTKNIPASLFGTLSLGTYEFFIFPALVAQVHSLHVLLLSALYYFLLKALKQERVKDLYYAAFIFGLGVAHNHAIIFALPSILLTLWFMRKRVGLSELGRLGGLGSLGVLLYGYTIFSALQHPALNWGRIHDIPSFLAMFFRSNYGSLSLTADQVAGPLQFSSLAYFFSNLIKTSWFVVLPALVSLVLLKRKDKPYLLLLLSWLLTGPIFFILMKHYLYTIVHQTLVEQFLPYSYYFLAVMAGLGVRYTVERLVPESDSSKSITANLWIPGLRPGMTRKVDSISSFFIIGFFLLVAAFTYPKVNQRGMEVTRDVTKYQLAQLPQNSILITTADGLYFPALYLQHTMKYRTDIRIINLTMLSSWEIQNLLEEYPDLSDVFPKGKIDFPKLCAKYAENQQLYLYPWYPELNQLFGKECTIYPYGLLSKASSTKNTPGLEGIKTYNDQVWKDLSRIPFASFQSKTTRVRETLYYVAEQYNYTGLYYLQHKKVNWAEGEFEKATQLSYDETNSITNTASIAFSQGQGDKAIAQLQEGIAKNPANAQLYYTLGIILLKQKDLEGAYKNLTTYLTFSPPNTQATQVIKQFITQYEKSSHLYGN